MCQRLVEVCEQALRHGDLPDAGGHRPQLSYVLPADWAAQDHQAAPGFVTRPGVFSADGPDPASVALAAHLPDKLPTRMVDLGAGWGWLSAQVLAHPGVEVLHLVEADAVALDCARRNVTDPRARFHWADALDFRLSEPVNGVVMNPPFHDGGTEDRTLGQSFIRQAADMLKPGGFLWLTANRHLPYEEVLKPIFKLVTLPLVLLTLGLFLIVINALLLMLTSWLSGEFGLGWTVDGFWPAVWGSVIISIVSFLLNAFVPDKNENRQR